MHELTIRRELEANRREPALDERNQIGGVPAEATLIAARSGRSDARWRRQRDPNGRPRLEGSA